MNTIIGRAKEQEVLKKAFNSDASQFIAVYGRRRVGKTFLIRETFQQDFAFFLTDTANINLHQHLSNFQRAMQKYHPDGSGTIPESWFAESLLHGLIQGKGINDK